jgi:hypothetical protein
MLIDLSNIVGSMATWSPQPTAGLPVGRTRPHKVLASTLTLSQPGGADYAHPILMSTPSFESHRRACNVIFGWGTKVYVQNQSGPSNGILHHFCLTGGPPSPVRITYNQVPWFMYQNRLGHLAVFTIRILCLALLFFISMTFEIELLNITNSDI